MLEIPLSEKKTVLFPQTWNEMKPEHVRAYAELVHPHRTKLVHVEGSDIYVNEGREHLYHSIRIAMLYALMGISARNFSKLDPKGVVHLLDEEKILDFLFLEYDLDINPFPVFRTDAGTLEGPTEFAQISFEEFSIADRAFVQWAKGEEDALDYLVQCLYRKRTAGYDEQTPDSTGDPRERFNQFTIKFRLEAVAKIPRAEKISIAIWYESQRDLVISNHEEVFDGDSTEEVSLAQIILGVGNGIPHFDLIRTSSVLLVLTDLKRTILENKAQEAARKARAAQQ